MVVFALGCDLNLKVSEELLEIIPVHCRVTGVHSFDELIKIIMEYDLPWKILVCVATDGAPAMTGILKWVVLI